MGPRWARAAAIGVVLAVVAACGIGDDDDDGDAVATFEREQGEDETTTTVDQTEGLDLDGVPPEDQDDVIIEAAIEEVEKFWDDRFPDLFGDRFQPVSGGFFPYGPDRPLPECGGPLTYEEIAGNAFYCPIEDLIAWDTDNLTNEMLAEFGPFALVIVMAHEYGHAIQTRAGFTGPTIAGEQQADCFAGAFAAFVNDGETDVLNVSVEDLDKSIAGFLTLRDAPGTPTTDPSAHGSAFDRVSAFQDGFQNGADRCAEYEEIFDSGGSTAIPLEFQTQEDFQSRGNAPFDPSDENNIFDLTLGSLETFWAEAMEEQFDTEWEPLFQDDQVIAFDTDDPSTLPECPGADITVDDVAGEIFTCFGDPDDPEDDFIAFDIDLAADLYRIGDFAVSGILSQQYSFVAQERLGSREDSKESFLQADCFSGAWAGAVTAATLSGEGQQLLPEFSDDGQPQAVSISAGDLDEAVQAFLLLREGADPDEEGSTFERVAAFRDGFLNGLDSCETYLEEGPPSEDAGISTDDSG